MGFAGVIVNVQGMVQGVGFRYWCRKKANECGVRGTVANLHDGSVEVTFEGERGLVEEFIKDLKVGSAYSHVTNIDIEWYDLPRGFNTFSIMMVD